MALPQEQGLLVAGLSAAAFGGLITCWCAWLECKVADKQNLARRLLREAARPRATTATADGAELVFETDAAVTSAEPVDPGDTGAGVCSRREKGPVYHSAAPEALAFESFV